MAKSDPKNWDDYEIVEQTDDNEYPPSKSLFTGSDAPQISESGRQASRLIDQRLTEIREQEDFGFDDATLDFKVMKTYQSKHMARRNPVQNL